jgi:uncharacterized protein (TIGR00369 family)
MEPVASKRRTRTMTWDDPMAGLAAAAGLKGNVTFVGEAGEHLYNPIGMVHGGFAMTILDSAMGCAVQTTLAAGEAYTTLETKVNFVRPITLDTGRVRCEGTVVYRGGRIATAPRVGWSPSRAASFWRTGRRHA